MNRFALALVVLGVAPSFACIVGACNMGPTEPASTTTVAPAAKAPPPTTATIASPTNAAVVATASAKVEPGADKAVVAAREGDRPGLVKLGEPVTAATVSLVDIAKNPKAYKGKSIATTGTVKAVCQEQGCWMEIVDAKADANVRMHGHAFFVPKTSSGKQAKVQGTVMLMKDGKECEEMAATGAQLQLDATGVELM